MRNRLQVVVVCTAAFALLAGAGIALYKVLSDSSAHKVYHQAYNLTVERMAWIQRALDVALLPLHSMAQFAENVDSFNELPARIGIANTPGALPFMKTNTFDPRRNVTGVCDDAKLVAQFTDIASEMKASLDDENILHSILLLPLGVVCLVWPINNTEDFDDGRFLDNTQAIGVDLFGFPANKGIAEAITENDSVGVDGPQPLLPCPACGNYFIARLAIKSNLQNVSINGHWGFASVLINWDMLLNHSQLFETFQEHNLEFKLTRAVDGPHIPYPTNQSDATLAVSEKFGSKAREMVYSMQALNSEWTIVVEYDDPYSYEVLVIAVTIVLASCISFLIGIVLVQKQNHVQMRSLAMTQTAKVDVERNMTAYFAHELRNPLSAIDCALQSLPREEMPESSRDAIAGMQLCSTFMSSIMNNLLDVRKMEEGRLELHADPCSLTTLVQDARKMALPTVYPGVDLRAVTETDGRDWVLGDEPRLQQILTNLVSNAIKYTKRGSVTIRVRWVKQHVCLECCDTGPGIPKEDQSQMFERFTQRGGAPGSGLGLAIAKQMVTLMAGTITFDSDPTVRPGTTCRVLLPLVLCEEPKEAQTVSVELEPIEEPLSILLIDDLAMNRTMLKRRLQKGIAPNCVVTEAENGEQALAICEQQTFDVIVVDQFMEEAGGVMVGTDVIIAMRRNKVSALIVGCSGNDLDEKFIAAGADLIWKKPMPPNPEIIRQFVDGLNIQ
jgi:signal transduction histidine kinase/CheY-like chemotaxis protein